MQKDPTAYRLLILVFIIAGIVSYFFYNQSIKNSVDDTSETSTAEQLPTTDSMSTFPAGSPQSEGSDTTTDEQAKTLEDISDDAGTSKYTIDTRNFSFSIDQIKARPGEVIEIELTNSGGTHDFVIDELNVQSKTINTGQSTRFSISIPSDSQGKTFTFYCSVGNHRAQGMEGNIIVAR
jgi:plastocyanin